MAMTSLNRKGIFYTVTAIILVVVMLMAFRIFEFSQAVDKNEVVLSKVKSTNNFVQNIDNDLDRAMRIACMRATLSLDDKIVNDGSFLSNASAAYQEAVMNGTIGSVSLVLMQNSTFPEWVARLQSEALKTGIVVSFNVSSVTIYQDDPWHVKGKINLSINVTDTRNSSSWHQHREIISSMSILGLEDPLYAVKTYGRAPNSINMTPYDGNYVSGVDVTNLNRHANNSYYANSTSAPSFLMRFEGNLSASPYGIESMVNLQTLQDQGLAVKQKSVIDYVYWGSSNTTDYRVTGTPSWFYIDSGHVARYQVGGLTY